VNFRRIGAGLAVAGLVVAVVGALAQRGDTGDGAFDPSTFAGALVLGGIAAALAGLVALVSAPALADLYQPGGPVTVQRRILQVGIPVALLALAAGAAATLANASG
jgi:hypothetical protein